VLSLMRQELRLAMSVTGCLDVADAGPELLA
jgi:isopentenyl diphosphate isomerase/L-lactate dehydrogenase-like FMN-dependent dehydrogenase